MRFFYLILSGILTWMFVGYCEDITFINSDETVYRKNDVICSGNVIVVYNDKVIAADEISFDKGKDVVTANGNVVMRDEKGNIYFMDKLSMHRDFSAGNAESIKILMPDKSRLAATDCRMKDKKLEMDNAVYTPCYESCCGDELTWQLKSRQVVFDPDDSIEYDDVLFEFLGCTAGYLPHLSIPSPRLKRKSGFLAPSFSVSSKSGFSVSPKYLFAISESQELILKPIITSKIGSVGWFYYGYRIKNGEFSIDASLTDVSSVKKNSAPALQEQKNIDKIQSSGYRGHLFSKMKYEINDVWRCSFGVNLASDYYYLKRFPFLERKDRALESNLKLEGFDGRNYTQMKAITFYGDPAFGSPKVLPMLERNFSDTLFGGTFGVDVMLMNLLLRDARSARKVITNVSWGRSLLLVGGHIIDFKGIASAKVINISEKSPSDYDSAMLVTPQLAVIWRWPLAVDSDFANTIVTPMVGIIAAGNKKYIDIFEDPFNETNDLNFIDGNRSISSYVVDSGSRVCYGLRISAYRQGDALYSFVVGRSTELTDVTEKLDESGMRYKNSNIVSSLEIFLSKEIALTTNCSYSTRKNNFSKFEQGLKFANNKIFLHVFAFSGKHCFYGPAMENISGEAMSENAKKYKGMILGVGWNMTKNTRLKSEMVLGGEKNKLIRQNIGLTYENECSYFDIILERTNYSGGDLRPDTSFRIEVRLKNLGAL
ncbi:MAG: LPS assembly protein LptD [Holosporaceae bacterium]|nr:LPS assembly protein LptD [Holosporaceae bacterium]